MIDLKIEDVLNRIEAIRQYGISTEGYAKLEEYRDELRRLAGLPSVRELMNKEG